MLALRERLDERNQSAALDLTGIDGENHAGERCLPPMLARVWGYVDDRDSRAPGVPDMRSAHARLRHVHRSLRRWDVKKRSGSSPGLASIDGRDRVRGPEVLGRGAEGKAVARVSEDTHACEPVADPRADPERVGAIRDAADGLPRSSAREVPRSTLPPASSLSWLTRHNP